MKGQGSTPWQLVTAQRFLSVHGVILSCCEGSGFRVTSWTGCCLSWPSSTRAGAGTIRSAVSLAHVRFTTQLIGLFALSTLLLGCVGVYGVVAHSASERATEMGVRIALGARPLRIALEIVIEGARIAVPGTVAGVLLAVPTVNLLRDQLFGVSVLDPLTFGVVPLLLLLAGLVAVLVPAIRSVRLDPAAALRGKR